MKKASYIIPSPTGDSNLLKIHHSFLIPRGPVAFDNGIPTHRHPSEFEFSLFTSGTGIYNINGELYDIRPYDLFFIKNNTPHDFYMINEDLHYMNVLFEPRFIWSNSIVYGKHNEHRYITECDSFMKVKYSAEEPITKKVTDTCNNIIQECSQKKEDYLNMIRAYFTILFVDLHRSAGKNFVPTGSSKFRPADMSAIAKSMDYIDRHLTEPLSLEIIAKESFLSKNYYCSIFKKINGISPWEYVVSKRVELVKSKLRDYEGSLLDLALTCGFNNTANFNHAFKKYLGVSPMKYKNQAGNQHGI